MRKLVPEIICRNYVEKKFEGGFESFVLTCDISGFTSITESLSEKSFEGSEIITDTINRIYNPVIDFIKDSGGFISSFAGDSFTSVFPVNKIRSKSITEITRSISRLLFGMEEIKTKFGDFKFTVKIGLSRGIVSWRIVESEIGPAFYFYGEAVKKSYDMLKFSSGGSAAIDDSVWATKSFDEESSYSKKALSKTIVSKKDADEGQFESQIFDEETLTKKFFPESVSKMSVSGEFRGIISCFVFLDEGSVLDENIAKAMEISSKYSGYFNKIDFGDKGWVILVVFGAPYGVENIYKKACNFAFETLSSLRGKAKIGMTSGTAYAGFLGSEKRAEYTVLGSTVNLASRIAQNSEWGEITVEKSMLKDMQRYCSVKKEKKQVLKGFEKNEISVCSLIQSGLGQQTEVFEGPFIAREEETDKFEKILKTLEQNKFAGVLLVEGTTGVGKTRFLNNAREKFTEMFSLNWVKMRCDDLISYSFKPFTEYLRLYFKTESHFTETRKVEEFENAFNLLLSKLEDEKLRSNLLFGKVFLGALLGLENSGVVYSKYDAKAVYDNTLSALKNFFLALSTLTDLVIEIEDTNWIDKDSLKLINFMVQNVESYPLLIVLSYRPTRALQDDIMTDRLNKIVLMAFEKDDSRFYVGKRIEELSDNNNFVKGSTVEKIIEITEGNPLFMEQIILFLKNKGKLDISDNSSVEDFEFPSDINSLIISRIDLLKYKLKNLVKIASVVGKDFDTQILSVVSSQGDISPFLREGEKESIWAPRSDDFYTFLHSMIRECVYRMQLKKDLVDLHQKTGDVIEKIYGDRIEEKYEELSYHYQRAENSSKSVFYLYKSAEKLRLKYRYSDASAYYEKLILALLSRGEDSFFAPELDDTILMGIDSKLSALKEETQLEQILIKAAEIERFLADWQKAEKYYRFAVKYSAKNKDMHLYYVSKRHLGRHLLSKGEYDEAQKILKEAELYFTKNHFDKELADVFGDLGFLFASQGDYAKALDYYGLQKSLYEKVQDEKGLSQVMLDQGVVFWRQGFMEKAMQAFLKQLEIARKIQDKRLYARAVGNIGLVHAMKGELEQAKDFLQENLKVFKELGDRVELSKTYGNLGVLNKDMGNLPEAERLFDQKLSVVKELGDRAEIQQVTANIGILKMQGGDVKMAKKYLKSALKMSNSLKDEKGKAFILGSLGQLYYKTGDLQKTIENYQKSLEISRVIGDQTGVFSSLGNIGTSYMELGHDKKALTYLKKQLVEAKKTGVERNLMYAMINLGIVNGKLKDLRWAKKYLQSAQKIALDLKNEKFSKDINIYIANAEIASKKYRSAEKRLKELVRISHDEETEIEAEVILLRVKNLLKSPPGELIENLTKLTDLKKYQIDKKIRAEMLYEITKSLNRIRKTPELEALSADEDFISQCLSLTESRKSRRYINKKPDRVLFLFAHETHRLLKGLNRERSNKDASNKMIEIKKVLERTKHAVIKKK